MTHEEAHSLIVGLFIISGIASQQALTDDMVSALDETKVP